MHLYALISHAVSSFQVALRGIKWTIVKDTMVRYSTLTLGMTRLGGFTPPFIKRKLLWERDVFTNFDMDKLLANERSVYLKWFPWTSFQVPEFEP